MKFYISASGIKRLTISSSVEAGGVGGRMKGGKGSAAAGGGGGTRRIYHRPILLPVVLMLGLLLPFLFVRIAFIVLESASFCSSSLDCMGWRIFGGNDPALVSIVNALVMVLVVMAVAVSAQKAPAPSPDAGAGFSLPVSGATVAVSLVFSFLALLRH